MGMKGFEYNGDLYIRVIPGKKLFRSTMVHEVVNRGDVFAIRVKDSLLTIIPGIAAVKHCEVNVTSQSYTREGDKVTLDMTIYR